ncbi:hypothetical protein SODALDRAFT_327353 [Sodiomyces alkalinus F11]|uniref:Uncharacterized protein n=1 Tax=Sodiomyces alkalinus (strain CBS 110278 / VKM F-3762 / F11) TaxID=1314773 RepID=A0A3N2Q973_SODAK|nr:hypothetical protein SODALDRAFT_327353 [Sodiomyces alkalinus F11]ROT43175.1 hypothetical protein SODALDRAFT_327353 [Sodiomyces alkalinus F11]
MVVRRPASTLVCSVAPPLHQKRMGLASTATDPLIMPIIHSSYRYARGGERQATDEPIQLQPVSVRTISAVAFNSATTAPPPVHSPLELTVVGYSLTSQKTIIAQRLLETRWACSYACILL